MWLPGYTRALAATLVLVTSIRAAGSVRIEPASEPMGTTFSVLLYGTGKARLETAAAAAFLDAHLKDDPRAREWLVSDAKRWLGTMGDLRRK